MSGYHSTVPSHLLRNECYERVAVTSDTEPSRFTYAELPAVGVPDVDTIAMVEAMGDMELVEYIDILLDGGN